MIELHEIDLKTFEDKIIKFEGLGYSKKYLSENNNVNLKKYYYIVTVYRYRYEDFCEICGRNFKELYEINPKNEISYSGRLVDRYICNDCAKPILIQLRWDGCKEKCKNHSQDCTCHYCQIGIELGYKKKNNNWIK